MQYLAYWIFEKINRYRVLLSNWDISVSMLTLLLGFSIFVGFVVVKQQKLSFSLQDIRSSAARQAEKETVLVKSAVDGDTILLEDGRIVRYIGIDTPEVDECLAKSAAKYNRDLVEGREVKIEKDKTEKDKYERLLRYIWIGDVLVNEEIVARGFARSTPIAPDIKYSARLFKAQQEAQKLNLGIWGACD